MFTIRRAFAPTPLRRLGAAPIQQTRSICFPPRRQVSTPSEARDCKMKKPSQTKVEHYESIKQLCEDFKRLRKLEEGVNREHDTSKSRKILFWTSVLLTILIKAHMYAFQDERPQLRRQFEMDSDIVHLVMGPAHA